MQARFGILHPGVTVTRMNLALCYDDLGDAHSAMELLIEAESLLLQCYGAADIPRLHLFNSLTFSHRAGLGSEGRAEDAVGVEVTVVGEVIAGAALTECVRLTDASAGLSALSATLRTNASEIRNNFSGQVMFASHGVVCVKKEKEKKLCLTFSCK